MNLPDMTFSDLPPEFLEILKKNDDVFQCVYNSRKILWIAEMSAEALRNPSGPLRRDLLEDLNKTPVYRTQFEETRRVLELLEITKNACKKEGKEHEDVKIMNTIESFDLPDGLERAVKYIARKNDGHCKKADIAKAIYLLSKELDSER